MSPGDREALLAPRSALVLASAAAGLAGPIDGVTGNTQDDDALRDDLAHARRLGLTGKLCVRPRQVGIAAEAFRPTAAELGWARKVVAAGAAGGVTTLDGQMIDAPPSSPAPTESSTENGVDMSQPLLQGRTAVITGAAQGIGFAIAELFVAEGARVVLGDIDADAAATAAARLGGDAVARGVGCDVTSGADVEAMIAGAAAAFGSVDVMVNNAGITRDASMAR